MLKELQVLRCVFIPFSQEATLTIVENPAYPFAIGQI